MRLPGSCTELWIDRDSEECWIIGEQWIASSEIYSLMKIDFVSLRRARGQLVRSWSEEESLEKARCSPAVYVNVRVCAHERWAESAWSQVHRKRFAMSDCLPGPE